MTLKAFLIVISLLLPLLCLAFYPANKTSKSALTYFILLVLALLASYWTFVHYAKSHGDYYKNTDYHIIQQNGFKYPKGQTLWICDDDSIDRALLSTDIGNLWIDDSMKLKTRSFKLPLYVQDNAKDQNDFKVANNYSEYSMYDGEELILKDQQTDTILLKIKYEEVKEKKKIKEYRFVFSLSQSNQNDTVYQDDFNRGYNLAALLQEGYNTLLDANMLNILGKCYIIRDRVDNLEKDKISGPVYLFGSNITVCKNGQVISHDSDNPVNLDINNLSFFYGIGHNQSPIYQVQTNNKNVFIEYRLPKMYHFPDDINYGETKMFLTTDIQDIVENSNNYNCFYQFLNQTSDNNIYKASAIIEFIADNAGVSLNPRYIDLTDDLLQTEAKPLTPDKAFELKTISCQNSDAQNAQLSYVFEIRDLRKNDVYNRAKWLYIVLIVLFGIVFALLHYLSPNDKIRINKLYIIETSVYLVLIAFLTVRLVLLWRLHTFPPIENVSKSNYDKMTGTDYFTWTFVSIIVILALRIGILVGQRLFAKKSIPTLNKLIESLFDRLDGESFKKGLLHGVVLSAITYGICYGIGQVDKLSVLIRETIAPLLAFAINSIFYVYRIQIFKQYDEIKYRKRGVYCWTAIITNTCLLLLFLYFLINEQGMLMPMVGMFALWFLISVLLTDDRKYFKWLIGLGSIIVLLIVFLHVPFVKDTKLGQITSQIMGSRISARLETLAYTPTEMVEKEGVQFKGEKLRRIVEASSNKWFIESHLNQRYYLNNHGKAFVVDKDYNILAVNHLTQTRDVLLVRFLIYEHGKWVAILLLIIVILLAINVFVIFKYTGNEITFLQQLPIQSALFIVVMSAYLVLVNVNAVIFVGLDFPFLTLTSIVAPMGLLLPLLTILLPLNIRKLDESLSDELSEVNSDKRFLKKGGWCLALLLMLIMIPAWRSHSLVKKSKGEAAVSFAISMEPLANFVNNYLNPKLLDYQTGDNRLKNVDLNDKNLKVELKQFLYGNNGKSIGALEAALSQYTISTRRYSDTLFIKSAFDKFFNTSLIDTRSSLLHIRKVHEKFRFTTNKQYFDMKPIFKNDAIHDWEGDLLASKGTSKISFECDRAESRIKLCDGYYVYGNNNDYSNNIRLLKKTFLGTNAHDIIAFNIYQIPSNYCYLPEEGTGYVYVIVPNDTKDAKRYAIYPAKDVTNPINASNIALRIKLNDIVKVNGMSQSFSFKVEKNQYFSKRLHYNGKHQVVYPLGKSFMFAYNFDQMLANNYHPSDSARQPVRISLDYDLFKQVYAYCDKTMQTDRSYGDGVTVTAIDGLGRIRLLSDYNPRNANMYDPNKSKELQKKMEEIYLNGNDKEEKSLLQNRNVTKMLVGPGSTIKVPFYVASAARIDTDWSNFGVYFTNNETIRSYDSTQAVVKNFGNYSFKGIHNYDGWDEMAGEYRNGETVKTAEFISSSNNFFFGSMLALSTHSTTQLSRGLNNTLVSCTNNELVFPKFSVNGNFYKFKDNFFDDYDNTSIALEDGLLSNFNFLTRESRDYTLQSYDVSPTNYIIPDTDPQSQLSKLHSLNSLYVYSERPILHRDIEHKTDNDIFKDILHITSGGVTCLDVTPLNMAEMYLRIALLNSADNILTYCDNVTDIPKNNFNTASDSDVFQEQMKRTAYLGMWNVINEDGGAHRTLKNDASFQNDLSSRMNPIYVYAKTGTIGDGKQSFDNKHYAYILTNKPLHISIDRDNLKVYVVYFGYYNTSRGHSGTAESRKEILNRIIDSETFKTYWNN